MKYKSRRISETDVKAIIKELDKWALGHLGSKLTWDKLEISFQFSRQAMQAKPEIKAAYLVAKRALSGDLVRSKEELSVGNDQLICKLNRLTEEIAAYQLKELQWKKRWQRIAYYVREKGIQVQAVDRELPSGAVGPSERETAIILRPFDNAIPPSGRG